MVMEKNPISKLQEICQQWKFPMPTYSPMATCEGEGKVFSFETLVSVNIAGNIVKFHATGQNKRESKTKVAQKVLEFIQQHYPQFLVPPPPPRIHQSMSTGSVFKKPEQSNKPRKPEANPDQSAPETNQLGDTQVGLDLGGVLQQARQKVGVNQQDSAANINKSPISRLQEICQQWKFPMPTYSPMPTRDGERNLFRTEVSFNIPSEIVTEQYALGRKKRESKTKAAQKVLEFIEQEYPEFLDPPLHPELLCSSSQTIV